MLFRSGISFVMLRCISRVPCLVFSRKGRSNIADSDFDRWNGERVEERLQKMVRICAERPPGQMLSDEILTQDFLDGLN